MKRPLAAILIVVVVLVGWSLKVRQSRLTNEARAEETQRQIRQSPQWQHLAATFDKHKAPVQKLFDSATKIQTFRLFSAPGQNQKALGSIRGFPYYAQATVPDKTFAHRLGDVLFDPKTYTMPGQAISQCYFEPGVAVRVWSGPKYADAVICFHCDQLGVVENDPHAPQHSIGETLNGHMNVWGEFKPERDQLLTLIKEAFASDEAVQAVR